MYNVVIHIIQDIVQCFIVEIEFRKKATSSMSDTEFIFVNQVLKIASSSCCHSPRTDLARKPRSDGRERCVHGEVTLFTLDSTTKTAVEQT